ncbi:MGH1-like glycoside hydrolase domain-containing protein [Tundrisphaera sp. TA3]|uniref:MGH1-like glycoside hydrolase domain-containing protein n=1 Tax=Tundrisphaera sp. TA3 TaxID=3435775 RepID=UPI003EB71A05
MATARRTSAEHERLEEINDSTSGWRRWGPYVSDRAWATVREDYSEDGDAWDFLPHDLARSKAYRWGEDGIAGICDRYQLLVFAPAFWNGNDPILKERLFGLSGPEGNHGEDVKEYYFYVDGTPTHSYLRFVYKYPHAAYPYQRLIDEAARRGPRDPEFELLDTGVFDEDRYFDIVVEYAKVTTEDIAIRITATNRGPDPAPLHLIPHLWFRNTWGWEAKPGAPPRVYPGPAGQAHQSLVTDDSAVECVATIPVTYRVGQRILFAPPGGTPLFTDNETNQARVFGCEGPGAPRFVKDAFHRHIIDGEDCLKPDRCGTKAAIHYHYEAVPPGESVTLRLRLADSVAVFAPLSEVDEYVDLRRSEADDFYEAIHPPGASADEKMIQRQSLAGLLWTKQSYLFDVSVWLNGDNPDNPPPASRARIRNEHWGHLNSMRVMTVPDKWEYPWFAAWDLAFQCVPLALVDANFAKNQLWCLLFEQFQHPNGQIPAYEWEFSDLNPPVHAWAVWRVYNMDRIRSGSADRDWLERCFHKLMINFAWWINKVDRAGNNIFEGGFLGLDNIAVVDRSEMDGDAVLEQSDATGWMGMFCLNLMRIALELAKANPVYEALATKYFQHYTYVASAMKHMGNRDFQLWDEEDGFFYDVLRHPDGRFQKFRVRSLVGLIPLFAVERLEESWIEPFHEFRAHLHWFLKNRREQVEGVVHTIHHEQDTTHALTILNQDQLRRITAMMMDPDEFLSPFGIRSMSKAHTEDPFHHEGKSVGYEPAEAITKIKGGNSNWRGPIWFPTTFLLIESLRKLGKAFGGDVLDAETPGIPFNDMAREIAERLIAIFARDETGRRPVYGNSEKFQDDPHWRDFILFYEYFNGDTGQGLGASHQTGWTSLIASLIDEWRD